MLIRCTCIFTGVVFKNFSILSLRCQGKTYICTTLISKECITFKGTGVKGSSDLLWSRVVRRPSVVFDNLHFQLLLQNRLIDFDETWYGWSTQGPLQVLLFSARSAQGQIVGGTKIGHGAPFFKELLLQTGTLQQQTECITVI